MKKRRITVGLIGLGTVGLGAARILSGKRADIERKTGTSVVLTQIADINPGRKKLLHVPGLKFVADAQRILEDPGIDIVVELIGGINPAKQYITKAIKNGKHVVTANKALLATYGPDIFTAAHKSSVAVGFEAAVAGGIPIIKVVRESLVANRIRTIYGIINGTSNYILSKMTDEAVDFGSALREAQQLGFAEADPTLDINGVDAAHKLAILAALSFGRAFPLSAIYTEGIARLSPLDIQFAGELGYKIKLLAVAKLAGTEVELRVHPTMLPKDHLITNVQGVFNAIYVEGDAVGPSLYYGKGAGEMPTASAVVSDIVDIAKSIISGSMQAGYFTSLPQGKRLRIKNMDEVESCYYFRFSVRDKPGVLSKISGILGARNISIKSVIQKKREKEKAVPLVMMTHRARARDINLALAEIRRLPVVSGKTVRIMVEQDEE